MLANPRQWPSLNSTIKPDRKSGLPPLHVQKSILVFLFGQKTAIASTEDAVAIACNYLVTPLAKPPGKDSQQDRCHAPAPTDLSQHGDDGIGTQQEAFLRLAAGFDEVHRVEVERIEGVTAQDSGREIALQGGEAESTIDVAPQAELHQSVAESANPVIKKDRRGGIICRAQRDASDLLCSSGTYSAMLPFSSK